MRSKVGEKLRLLRKRNNWSQKQLADEILRQGGQTGRSAISLIESGHRWYSRESLTDIARALSVRISDLVGEDLDQVRSPAIPQVLSGEYPPYDLELPGLAEGLEASGIEVAYSRRAERLLEWVVWVIAGRKPSRGEVGRTLRTLQALYGRQEGQGEE